MPTQKTEKASIIQHATSLFRTRGYHRTSMADIGAACGIFKSGLYHYFPNKEVLLREVIRESQERVGKELFRYFHDPKLSPREKMAKYLEHLDCMHCSRAGGCLFANIALEVSSEHNEIREVLKEFFSLWREEIATVLLEAGYQEEESKNEAVRIIETIEGSIMLARVFDNKDYMVRAAKNLLDTLNLD